MAPPQKKAGHKHPANQGDSKHTALRRGARKLDMLPRQSSPCRVLRCQIYTVLLCSTSGLWPRSRLAATRHEIGRSLGSSKNVAPTAKQSEPPSSSTDVPAGRLPAVDGMHFPSPRPFFERPSGSHTAPIRNRRCLRPMPVLESGDACEQPVAGCLNSLSALDKIRARARSECSSEGRGRSCDPRAATAAITRTITRASPEGKL